MGALFIFSGISKLVSQYTFLASLRALPFLPSWSVTLVGVVLPWMEVVIGGALVVGFLESEAACVALALLLAFSLVAIGAIIRGLNVPCSCFGTASRDPLSWRTVGRNTFIALFLVPPVIFHRWTPLSADAMLNGSAARSLADILLLLSFPLCVVGLAALVATAQKTLTRVAAR